MSYSFFSGANVLIKIGEAVLLECAGISFGQQESKQPIYGYASREFDAVLIGRKIVQGTFVINYTDSRYLEKILLGEDAILQETVGGNRLDFNNKGLTGFNLDVIYGSSNTTTGSIAAASQSEQSFSRVSVAKTRTDAVENKVDLRLVNCHLLGRSQTIQINDQVILEEYSFIARRIEKIRNQTKQVQQRATQ